MLALEKDSCEYQRARVVRVVSEMSPRAAVEFDELSPFIKFRVRDNLFRMDLTEPSGEWLPFILADKSDDRLRSFIRHLSNGKL